MIPATSYRYEIEFDIVGACQNEYDRWLGENSVTWASHDAVTSFQVCHNSEGRSPEVRLIFGFQSAERRDSFVNSSVHKNAKEALSGVTTGFDGRSWDRSGIRLTQDTDRETAEPSPCDELPPIPEEPL